MVVVLFEGQRGRARQMTGANSCGGNRAGLKCMNWAKDTDKTKAFGTNTNRARGCQATTGEREEGSDHSIEGLWMRSQSRPKITGNATETSKSDCFRVSFYGEIGKNLLSNKPGGGRVAINNEDRNGNIQVAARKKMSSCKVF